MPTRIDYEQAAAKLRSAAAQVADLTLAAERAGASKILRGGSLGREVPDRIAACAATAAGCAADIIDVATTCAERAGVIADYEAELQVYDRRYAAHRVDLANWQRDFDAWYHTAGATPHPGPPPVPPPKPVGPPGWADVRRV